MYNKEIKLGTGLLAHKYQYFYDPTHPLALVNGCVYYHRHLKSVEIGRWLTADEEVHHINEDTLDNRLDNLQILSKQEHARLHRDATYIINLCLTCNTNIETTKQEDKQFCSLKCAAAYRIKDKTITKELLDELIPLYPWSVLGPMFGYSDNGIKKRAKVLGCDLTKAKYRHKKF